MMDKRTARNQAYSREYTVGELRGLIAGARGRGGQSRVNKALPLKDVLDIYERALDGRADAELYDITVGRGSAVMTVTNILRDTS